jgi:glycosyltransferase involved in cell wall biosynthesis
MERYSLLLNTSPATSCSYRAIEGLLSGLIPVSVRSKDLALIVEHGRTGFLGDTAQELSEYILALHSDMALCRRISDLSRARACELFHHERFLAEWEQLLRQVAG